MIQGFSTMGHGQRGWRLAAALVLLLALLGGSLALTPVARADSIVVTTADDEDDTGADCSLREAIVAANSDTAYGGCPTGDGFDSITFNIGGGGPVEIVPGFELPAITAPVSIEGPTQAGVPLVTIRGTTAGATVST
jgi:CSLREA domain-containing protein